MEKITVTANHPVGMRIVSPQIQLDLWLIARSDPRDEEHEARVEIDENALRTFEERIRYAFDKLTWNGTTWPPTWNNDEEHGRLTPNDQP